MKSIMQMISAMRAPARVKPRHRDRLMADVERLARASAWWYWSCGAARDAEEREAEDCLKAAARELNSLRDGAAALAHLKTSGTAKRHAAHALRREGLPIYGYGWFPVLAPLELSK